MSVILKNETMESRSIIIHIGSYKTATSYIQNTFHLNASRILKEHGVLYPKAGLTKSDSTGKRHKLLVKALQKNDAKLFSKLSREFNESPCRIMFISVEYLSRLTMDEIEKLKSYLPDVPIKILFTVRKQDQFIESLYSEYTQHNKNCLDFESFIAAQAQLLDYFKIATDWSRVFGQENIIVSGFESNKKKGVIEEIFGHMSINEAYIDKLRKPKESNTSIGEKNVQLMFNLNHSLPGYKGLKKIGHYIKIKDFKDRPVSMFTPIERTTFLDSFKASNHMLIKTFGDNAGAELDDRSVVLPYKSHIYKDDSFEQRLSLDFKKTILMNIFRIKLIHEKYPSVANVIRQKVFPTI